MGPGPGSSRKNCLTPSNLSGGNSDEASRQRKALRFGQKAQRINQTATGRFSTKDHWSLLLQKGLVSSQSVFQTGRETDAPAPTGRLGTELPHLLWKPKRNQTPWHTPALHMYSLPMEIQNPARRSLITGRNATGWKARKVRLFHTNLFCDNSGKGEAPKPPAPSWPPQWCSWQAQRLDALQLLPHPLL